MEVGTLLVQIREFHVTCHTRWSINCHVNFTSYTQYVTAWCLLYHCNKMQGYLLFNWDVQDPIVGANPWKKSEHPHPSQSWNLSDVFPFSSYWAWSSSGGENNEFLIFPNCLFTPKSGMFEHQDWMEPSIVLLVCGESPCKKSRAANGLPK